MTIMPCRFRFTGRCVPFRQEGTAVIELAISMIFLLLLTMGITEIGRAFWYYSAIQKSARDGARCLSNLDWGASGSAGVADCRTLVVSNANSSGLQPVLAAANVTQACDGAGCTWGTGAKPQYVTVTVLHQMRWLWSIGGDLPTAGESSGLKVVATMPYMK